MTIDFTKPVQTRDGRKVRIICTDGPKGRPIVGIKEDSDVMCWASDGMHCGLPPCDSDLLNAPPVKHVRYVSFDKAGSIIRIYHEIPIQHHALVAGCARVELEQGRFDDRATSEVKGAL